MKPGKKFYFLFLAIFVSINALKAEDGYRLWLRYQYIDDTQSRQQYLAYSHQLYAEHSSDILNAAINELQLGIKSMTGTAPQLSIEKNGHGILLLGSSDSEKLTSEEAFTIKTINESGRKAIQIEARGDKGLLYGAFHLLKLIQRGDDVSNLDILETPRIQHRILNHWDNLDRTVERGYAGFSIWNWHELPEFISPQYIDYARANASIGINGAVVTNVNANALIFRSDYIEKAAALADVFRPYGIKLYLTARFSAPIELGGLSTADPLDSDVQEWWKNIAAELYSKIPDFGGFVVKANSEGQPGPQDYHRNHAEGANMLADAVNPYGGIVMWRAFVYSDEEPEDRVKQAVNEFVPLDGQFRDNVLIQVKNGPLDFQPREPFHPLFGAMPKTPLMMEFQITKEYLGQGTHLVGLANMYKEILDSDTHVNGKGSTVAKVIDGSLHGHALSGIAGVANIGSARNWTGNLFGQADWYAFGKLAWNPDVPAMEIFEEWAELTFSADDNTISTIVKMLDSSYETCVKYMTPLGLHHIMAANHHFGPGPWIDEMSRADWTSVYYHKADEEGIGFDRTASGSNAISQYHEKVAQQYEDIQKTPMKLLLWFHHVSWDHLLPTGRTLWDELCVQYNEGVNEVRDLKQSWTSLEGKVDKEPFEHVLMHLNIQEKEAIWWRDACLTYFQTFSKKEIPAYLEPPQHGVQYYKSINYPYAPGIRPRW